MAYTVSINTLNKWIEAAFNKGNMARYNELSAVLIERTQ